MRRLTNVAARLALTRSPHDPARTGRAGGPSARGGRRLRKDAIRACHGRTYPRSRPSPPPSTSCARRLQATLSGGLVALSSRGGTRAILNGAMSENLETVTRGIDAFNRRDVDLLG